MVKKIVVGVLLVGLIGVLAAGAVIRTVDKTAQVAEARELDSGQGNGRGVGQVAGVVRLAPFFGPRIGQAADQAADQTAQGRGNGQGNAAAGGAERQYANNEAAPQEWGTYEGTVVQAPASGADLVIQGSAGEEVVVGTGPGHMETQGFALQTGEQVQVQGYWEDDELKAAQITRLQDGQAITLRDPSGRPLWAGNGRRALEQQQTAVAPSGQGWSGRGQGQSGYGEDATALGSHALPGGEDLSESEVEALFLALDDEYKAWAVYDQVIADFGAARPFTSIQKAEENHIAALVTLLDRYGLDVPVNDWPGNVPTFDTLTDACEAGVQAEIENAALYDRLFSRVDNPDIIQVFTSLQQASQTQHLPAFERCSS
jgi:hypothetical protein